MRQAIQPSSPSLSNVSPNLGALYSRDQSRTEWIVSNAQSARKPDVKVESVSPKLGFKVPATPVLALRNRKNIQSSTMLIKSWVKKNESYFDLKGHLVGADKRVDPKEKENCGVIQTMTKVEPMETVSSQYDFNVSCQNIRQCCTPKDLVTI